MDTAVLDACVLFRGGVRDFLLWVAEANTISLPDKNDVHVVAIAIAAQAKSIVTYNGRHFPDRILAPLGLCAEMPDELCTRLFREGQADVIEGARLHRASLQRPSYDPGSYLNHLESLELKRTADLLRTCQGAI